jgi:alkylhydroperoxidase family enzyme
MDINSAGGREKGIDFEKLAAVAEYASSDLFTPVEKAALRYAEEMCKESVNVPDAVFDELRRYLSDDGIVELTSIIALENSRARFNRALLIPADGLCQLPADHPALKAAAQQSAAAG